MCSDSASMYCSKFSSLLVNLLFSSAIFLFFCSVARGRYFRCCLLQFEGPHYLKYIVRCLSHYLEFRVPAFKVVVGAAVSDLRDVPECRRKVSTCFRSSPQTRLSSAEQEQWPSLPSTPIVQCNLLVIVATGE